MTHIRAVHGIARHVSARLGRQMRLAVRAVHDPGQLSWAAQGCDSTSRVSTAHVKSDPKSCACGTDSQLHATAALPNRCVRASSEHWDGQSVEGDRPDDKIVVQTKKSKQEPPPAHTRANQRQRTRSAPSRVSLHRSVGGHALHTACRQHENMIGRAAGMRRPLS